MNEQIKKQTNMGIAFAVVGFALIGGALVLIPRLVDEKVKTLSVDTGTQTQTVSKNAAVNTPSKQPLSDNSSHTTAPSIEESPISAKVDTSKSNQPERKVISTDTNINRRGTWTLTLADKFEPDAAARTQLNAIVALMKSNPQMRLSIVGMNNSKKSSKLAQMGANKIANILMKETAAKEDRIDITTAQRPDMDNIEVTVSVAGGVQ